MSEDNNEDNLHLLAGKQIGTNRLINTFGVFSFGKFDMGVASPSKSSGEGNAAGKTKENVCEAESDVAKLVGNVFDSMDVSKCGVLPSSRFAELVEELGGDFYGNKLSKQLSEVDVEDN
eukprot:9373305-Ditylum_brightwellii.AAC.1